MNETKITVEVTVKAPITKAWNYFTQPEHVVQWNNASPDWHTPTAQNDFREGGTFNYRMEAKDGSFGFDFAGTYTSVVPEKSYAYTLDDGRNVTVDFSESDGSTRVVETFDAEMQNPIEMQKNGWQSIMNNFKSYVEKE